MRPSLYLLWSLVGLLLLQTGRSKAQSTAKGSSSAYAGRVNTLSNSYTTAGTPAARLVLATSQIASASTNHADPSRSGRSLRLSYTNTTKMSTGSLFINSNPTFSTGNRGSSVLAHGIPYPSAIFATGTRPAQEFNSANMPPSPTGAYYTGNGIAITDNSRSRLKMWSSTILPIGPQSTVSNHPFPMLVSTTAGTIISDRRLNHFQSEDPSHALTQGSNPYSTASPSQNLSPGPTIGTAAFPLTRLVASKTTQSQGGSVPSQYGASMTGVTSTDTDEPSDAFTLLATNTAWTENLWLTTERNGHTTVVPVIVGCPTCGGRGRGITLWNFPPIPGVKFKFPKMPRLPTIHFPCVPIPFIKSCSAPPASKYTPHSFLRYGTNTT